MNYIKPSVFININDYDYIVSIGNKCPTAMILRDLNLYKESFPFDYIPTTPKLILKYIQDTTDFFPVKNIVRTIDDVWFGHFNIDDRYEETMEAFQRRFTRLLDILNNKKRILFVYTSEADIYNEMGNRYNDNYAELCNIAEFIEQKYNYDNFTILAIHTNKYYDNTKNIINYTINIPQEYLSDDMSTHTDQTTSPYRNILRTLIKSIFQV